VKGWIQQLSADPFRAKRASGRSRFGRVGEAPAGARADKDQATLSRRGRVSGSRGREEAVILWGWAERPGFETGIKNGRAEGEGKCDRRPRAGRQKQDHGKPSGCEWRWSDWHSPL